MKRDTPLLWYVQLPQDKKTLTYNDIVQFQNNKYLILGDFEQNIRSKDKTTKDIFLSSLYGNADEMEHHGFYSSPYHNNMKNVFPNLKLPMSDKEAIAVMVAYQLSTPAERQFFKDNIAEGKTRELPEPMPKTEWTPIVDAVHDVGQIIIYQQGECGIHLLSPEIKGQQKNAYPYLLQQLQSMPPKKRHKARLILESVNQALPQSDINTSLERMTREMMPLFFKECSQPLTGTRQKKIEDIKQKIHIFGFMFLTQHEHDKTNTLRLIEVRKNRITLNRLLKNFSEVPYPCCCYD